MSADLGEPRIGGGDSLHVTSYAGVGHNVAVGGTGDLLAVCRGIGPHQHVGLRSVVRAEARAGCGRRGIHRSILTSLVAIHAERGFGGILDHLAVCQGNIAHGTNQVDG
jgi:hypothetical protein